MKPIIGITPTYDGKKETTWLDKDYYDAVIKSGGVPLVLPLTDKPDVLIQSLGLCHGLLLSGGHDIDPDMYDEAVLPECGPYYSLRDEMEQLILERALRFDMPVLGICRGIQIMNVVLGGNLYQDIPSQHESTVNHSMQPPYSEAYHKIKVHEKTPLAEIIGSGEHSVNSRHHQAVKALAPSVREMALSEDGICEGIFVPGRKFAVGVQWHPENMYAVDENSRKLFDAFVKACK